MDDLYTRVAALEKANRRMRAVSGLSLLSVAVVLCSGWQTPQDKVRAKAFEVVDDKGAVLASMTNFEGNGCVTTYTPSGKILVDVVPTKSNAGGIVVYDGKGHQNLIINDVAGGGGSLVVNNESQTSVVTLGHNTASAGSVTISTKGGNRIGLLTSDTTEAGVFLTYSAAGKETARVPSGTNSQPR